MYFGLLRWLLPIRLAVSVHGADLFRDGRRSQRYPWPIRMLVAGADALVAPSQAFLQECLAVFPRAARRGAAVHNGVDMDELGRPDPGAAGRRRSRTCCASRPTTRRRRSTCCWRPLPRSAAPTVAVRLVLVGDGPLRPQHEAQARALALGGRVEFLGERGRAEVARLLHGCSIFVLPSRSEPFGLVVTEALACRKAVVASAVGGIPEIIEDGRSGVLVEPDNPPALARALARMLGRQGASRARGQRGLRAGARALRLRANGRRVRAAVLRAAGVAALAPR